MDAKTIWKGNLSFTGSAGSGCEIPLGVDQEAGGKEGGFLPMELFAIGLAGCTAMDVISILTKKRQEITAFEVTVHAERAQEHPRVITQAEIEYHITGHAVDEAAVIRSIELSTIRYCPAQAMLGKVFPIDLRYFVYEDEGNGIRRLTKSGVYLPAVESPSM